MSIDIPQDPDEPRTVADEYAEWLPPVMPPLPGYVWSWDSDAGIWIYLPQAAISPTRPDMPTVADSGRIVYDPLLLERYRPDELTELVFYDESMFHVSRRTRAHLRFQDGMTWLTRDHFPALLTCLYLIIVGVLVWLFT